MQDNYPADRVFEWIAAIPWNRSTCDGLSGQQNQPTNQAGDLVNILACRVGV
jgi:hypothetical protein